MTMPQEDYDAERARAQEKSDNRNMIILSVVIIAFILGIMGLNMMLGGGDSAQTQTEAPAAAGPATQVMPSPGQAQ